MPFAPERRVEPRHHAPTGRPAWTRLLLSGPPHSWKSGKAVEFSADARLGGMFWLEIGDGQDTAEEYGVFPGANYKIIEHDGTFLDIHDQLTAHWWLAQDAEAAGLPPIALTIDDMAGLNSMLLDMGDARARTKRVESAARANMPTATFWGAEYDATITTELRNLIKKRHGQIMRLVRNWPGPVVLVTSERIATVFVNGEPTDRRDWWLECRKDLPTQVSAHVRLDGPRPATVLKLRSGRQFVDPTLPDSFTAENFSVATLVFDWIGCVAGESRAPADRVYDADQDMPDEVRVDRSGRPLPKTQTPEEVAARAARARETLSWMLEARTAADAAERAAVLRGHAAKQSNILPYLDADVRERLGVDPDAAELTLASFAIASHGYVVRHRRSASDPVDEVDEAPAEVPADDVAEDGAAPAEAPAAELATGTG